MALFAAMAAAIHTYTGLSPTAFFTILTLMVATYLIVSSLFVHPDAGTTTTTAPVAATAAPDSEPKPPLEMFVPPEPVQVGEITLEQLRAYDGKDPKKQLLIAIKGKVYDTSRGRLFYGPQGPYSFFAGREISRALALMSFDPEDFTSDIEDLSPDELEVLQDWEEKFKERYPVVGRLLTQQTHPEDVNQNIEQAGNVEEPRQETVNEAAGDSSSVEQVRNS